MTNTFHLPFPNDEISPILIFSFYRAVNTLYLANNSQLSNLT
jgi:hypothetical protein